MKKTIKMNERELHRLISESVNKIMENKKRKLDNRYQILCMMMNQFCAYTDPDYAAQKIYLELPHELTNTYDPNNIHALKDDYIIEPGACKYSERDVMIQFFKNCGYTKSIKRYCKAMSYLQMAHKEFEAITQDLNGKYGYDCSEPTEQMYWT